jgi:phosphonate transport system substrate-binding protein
VKAYRLILLVFAVCILGLLAFWFAGNREGQTLTPKAPATGPATQPSPIHIALVPEQDVFALRRSHQALIKYLSGRLGQPVELVTLNTYEAVLMDFQEKRVEAAFLGSLVGLLAIDRLGAQVIAKPDQPDGVSSYRGIIFTRADSPVNSIDDLRGRSIAMLKTTTAGALFPVAEMTRRNMLNTPNAPKIVWMGTHDEVISAVLSGKADAGAVKDLRLEAFEMVNPQQKVKRLATSRPVPNRALVLRRDVASELAPRLYEALKAMESDPEGKAALAQINAVRFIPCRIQEYEPIYEMVEQVGPEWKHVGVGGEAPRRPEPTTRP